MRGFLRGPKERSSGSALWLSVVAAVLALLSLLLAAYAVRHILSTRQDVWLSYPAGIPGGAPAALGVLALVVALALLTLLVVPGLLGYLRALAAHYKPF